MVETLYDQCALSTRYAKSIEIYAQIFREFEIGQNQLRQGFADMEGYKE
jgi:hypothetical protein